MADILIRGVPMPVPDFHTTIIIMGNGDVLWYNEKVGTAIPLPEGHGRLGDLDALMNNIGDVPYKGAVRRVLMSAPTIVPPEGGTDNGN